MKRERTQDPEEHHHEEPVVADPSQTTTILQELEKRHAEAVATAETAEADLATIQSRHRELNDQLTMAVNAHKDAALALADAVIAGAADQARRETAYQTTREQSEVIGVAVDSLVFFKLDDFKVSALKARADAFDCEADLYHEKAQSILENFAKAVAPAIEAAGAAGVELKAGCHTQLDAHADRCRRTAANLREQAEQITARQHERLIKTMGKGGR